jgi:16S rRNA (guanine966-N2)-methyltransferase
MRVVSGEVRGRRLVAPKGVTTRPTSDRVRQATFNALASLGYPDDATVVDLFAGSGALGIEALSRGAAHCTFVDSDRHAIAAIEANLAATGLAGRATVVRSDVLGWLRSGGSGDRTAARADLALADPPYGFSGWHVLLASAPAPLVVVESDREVEVPPGWLLVRSKRYGVTVVEFLERRQTDSPALPSEKP